MVSVLAHEEIVQVNSGRAVTPPILKGKPEGRHVLWHIADPVDDRMNGSSVTGEDSEGVAPACSRIIALVERGRRRLFAEAARRPPLRFGPSKRQKGGVKTILRIWATPSAAPQRWNGRQAANSSRRSEDQLGGQSQFARAAYVSSSTLSTQRLARPLHVTMYPPLPSQSSAIGSLWAQAARGQHSASVV
jgi:hypothetical protein